VRPWLWQVLGVLLFLFIPLVLYLFVAHPAPVGASVGAGLLLMLGHRFLARPYMEAVRARKCLWCNRVFEANRSTMKLPVEAGGATVDFATCARHDLPAVRFFRWLDRLRLPLRLGIGAPLLFLLGTLAMAASGRAAPTALAVDLFRLVVGLTVNVAALGPWLGPSHDTRASPLRAAFPAHNFSLLGIRAILWIFRIVGVYWIWVAGRALLARLAV
jgi:hypothetical protein